MPKKRSVSELKKGSGNQRDSQAREYLAEEISTSRRPAARVLTVPLNQIWPDRFQPRPIVPAPIKQEFFRGDIDWRGAVDQWLLLAKANPAIQQRIGGLVNMGDTIDEHGQIKPATGFWQGSGESRRFYLETGERRFWAKALNAAMQEEVKEPILEVREVVEPSRKRQVIENRHAEPPTAVARAREIAALVLSQLDIHPEEDILNDNDYFRTAISIKRMPAGLWDEVSEVMQLSRPVMVRTLNILNMPDALLEIADVHNVPERSLREILILPEEQWYESLANAIEEGWTLSDFEHNAASQKKQQNAKGKSTATSYEKAGRRARSFLNLAIRPRTRKQVGRVATEIATGYKPEDISRIVEYLEELVDHLRLRAQGEGS